MPLSPGSHLGPYEILSALGAGGMGEVYRARDTRLGRDVAIKVLPADLSHRSDLRQRFEREARAVSSLNHPNICTLHDIGRQDDVDFLVMECLEGETLAARIARGPLPLDELMPYAIQIADALDKAHRQGVVHRDLKPGNVMLTKTGAKLLDFGLARAPGLAPDIAQSKSQSPTMMQPLTSEGSLLGTFQYMAPEQLEGKEADARSDIFAFGAVLYEMATGRAAFEGKSQASLIVAIMSASPPPMSSLQPMSPPALERLVRTCLAKDPEKRYQSAHDLKLQLEWVAEGGSQVGVPAPVAAARRRKRGLVGAAAIAGWVVAVGALMALACLGLIARRSGDTDRPFRVELVPPAEMDLLNVTSGPIVLSPDGSTLAFIAAAPGFKQPALGVRNFATGESKLLTGTEGAEFPFWSADSRWIGFFAEGKLRKILASGGPLTTLCDAHAGRGGTWNRAGVIVFAPDITGPLFRVPEDGGTPAQLTHPKDDKWTHRMPAFFPDGKHFVFIERESNDDPFGHISVGSIDGGDTRRLVDQGSNPQFADGFLFFCRDGNLVAQRLGPKSLQLEGSIVPMFSDLEYYNPRDVGNFSVSQNGLLAFRQRESVQTQLAWYDRSGHEIEVLGEPGYYSQIRLSRDGKMAAVVRDDAGGTTRDVWTMDLDRRQMSRSTFVSTTGSIDAAFSPDGKRLAISSSSGTGWNSNAVWIQPVAGSRVERKLLASTRFSLEDWSPDGSVLIGDSQEASTGHNLSFVRLDADPPNVAPLVASKFDEQGSRFSPDGRWIAYNSDESGQEEIYLTDFPEARRKWQISQGGGGRAVWSKDGREIYYSWNDGVMAVTLGAGDPPEIGKPARLDLPRQVVVSGIIAGDGKRFLALRFAKPPTPQPVRLIRNWRGLVEK